jgi:hypothetical protein
MAAACERAIDDDFSTADPANIVKWLSEYWCSICPREPMRQPDAVSLDSRGIQRIRWYANDAIVVGYVPGFRGGFALPVTPRDERTHSLPVRA